MSYDQSPFRYVPSHCDVWLERGCIAVFIVCILAVIILMGARHVSIQ